METVRKGRVIPARVQTVVIFLPDIRSCIPTRVEWDELNIKYKRRLELELKKQTNDGIDLDKKKSKTSSSSDEKVIDPSDLNVIDEVGESSPPPIDDTQNNDGDADIKNADANVNKEQPKNIDGDGETTATIAATETQKALHTIISYLSLRKFL